MVTDWWWNAHLIHYSSLNPSKTIISEKYAQQINEIHPKVQPLHLTLVNRIGPILLHDNAHLLVAQPTLQKLNDLVYEVLPHPPYPPSLSPNYLPLLQASWQLFAFKMFPQPAGGRKCFLRVHWILKHGFLRYSKKLISHWQKCVDFSYFNY